MDREDGVNAKAAGSKKKPNQTWQHEDRMNRKVKQLTGDDHKPHINGRR